MQHLFLLLLRFQNKLKGNQQQHLIFNISLTLTGTSRDAGGKGRELEKRLSQNVFSLLTVHLADIIIFGNVSLLKVNVFGGQVLLSTLPIDVNLVSVKKKLN